jgi:hypothetical protein
VIDPDDEDAELLGLAAGELPEPLLEQPARAQTTSPEIMTINRRNVGS